MILFAVLCSVCVFPYDLLQKKDFFQQFFLYVKMAHANNREEDFPLPTRHNEPQQEEQRRNGKASRWIELDHQEAVYLNSERISTQPNQLMKKERYTTNETKLVYKMGELYKHMNELDKSQFICVSNLQHTIQLLEKMEVWLTQAKEEANYSADKSDPVFIRLRPLEYNLVNSNYSTQINATIPLDSDPT